MTVPQRITHFLVTSKPKAFCDDCIASLLKLARRQQAQQATSSLGTSGAFRRQIGRCANCGSTDKMVTG